MGYESTNHGGTKWFLGYDATYLEGYDATYLEGYDATRVRRDLHPLGGTLLRGPIGLSRTEPKTVNNLELKKKSRLSNF